VLRAGLPRPVLEAQGRHRPGAGRPQRPVGRQLPQDALRDPVAPGAALRAGADQYLGAAPGGASHRVAAGVVGPLRALRGYAFTVVGIAIGVADIVALGAMAERIVRFIEGGDRVVLGQISVAGKGMGMGAGFTGGGLLPARVLRRIAEVDGVSGVQAQVMLPLNPSTSQFMTLTQELLMGMDLSVPSPNRYY